MTHFDSVTRHAAAGCSLVLISICSLSNFKLEQRSEKFLIFNNVSVCDKGRIDRDRKVHSVPKSLMSVINIHIIWQFTIANCTQQSEPFVARDGEHFECGE